MQSCLHKQMKDFLYAANIFMPIMKEVDLKPFEDELIDIPAEKSVEPEDVLDGSLNEDVYCKEEDDDEAIL